jgi:hypothetical protein
MSLKKMMYATVALMTSWASPALAVEVPVYGPICDTAVKVSSTTYYSCSGGSHTAIDVANGSCGEWLHRGMLGGSFYYVYYGGCANTCFGDGGCNGGLGNYFKVTGSNGWDWRQLHLNANAYSYSKTCDRCPLGLLGGTGNVTRPHVHADNRKDGVRSSAWYTNAGTTCGSSAYCGNIIGYATL